LYNQGVIKQKSLPREPQSDVSGDSGCSSLALKITSWSRSKMSWLEGGF